MTHPLSSSEYSEGGNVMQRGRGRTSSGEPRSFMAQPIVQTRAIFSLIALGLAWLTPFLGPWRHIAPCILGYVAVIIVGTALLGERATHKFWRTMPELLDVFLISVLVANTGAITSVWFLLYLFPVMSVSRYLGRRGSAGMAFIAILAYGFVVAQGGYSSLMSMEFGVRALVLLGAALTAANLSRQRDEDASLLKAVETIDREILNNADVPQLMRSILQSAMDVTDSSISAIALIDDGRISEIHAEAVGSPSQEDKAQARHLMEKYATQLMIAGTTEWLRLPQQRLSAAPFLRVLKKNVPDQWTGRLALLKVDERAVGILGVFSRRFVHYTENDVRRLSSMAPLVELARKHAKVFADLKDRQQESNQRLQLLYDIGEILATERGLDTLFRSVVRLVSNHLRSEEAALFIPDGRGENIIKRAVWGPDADTRKKLEGLETVYPPGERSLTRRVYDGTDLDPSYVIDPGEIHAEEYGKVLPSGRTRDYLGAQLRIGSEVLGVIRVLNKKAENYTVNCPELAAEGFKDDDQNLMDMIATQVAAAIRSASFVEKHRYFQGLIDKSPDPIIVLDERGKVRNFNKQAQKIWNLTEDDVRGVSVVQFYSSETEARRVGDALLKAEGGTISDFMTQVRIGEDVVPVRLSASLLIENNKCVGSIGLFKEQTERIRLAEEEQLEALRLMARSFGHAIKNDLGTIENRLESARHKAQGDVLLLKYFSAIRERAASIRSKLDSMLSTTKTEPLPRKALVSVGDLLRNVEAAFAHEAADVGVTFTLVPPDPDAVVLGDVDRLREVLVNFFANSIQAIKAARDQGRLESGRITVEATIDTVTSRIRIDWRDDGIGMSGDTVRKAFAPYFTTKSTGSGLGLFNSRRTVESHGGTISAKSTEGAGSLFRITLPLSSDHQPTTEATAP